MDMVALIASVGSLLAGSGVAGVLFYREKKRAEQLKNEASAAEQWKLLFERSDSDTRDKDARIDKLYDEQSRLRERLNKLSTENAVLRLKKCEVNGCNNRKPARGY